jgi:hypothetical protein
LVDYRKFLSKVETCVLPYFGGARVETSSRRLRLTGALDAPGWYTFEIKGREASPKGPADAPDLSDLSIVRGHVVGRSLVGDHASCIEMELMPEDEPPLFSPCRARRWHSGDLIFDALDFEGDAEVLAREALEDGRSLDGVKGIGAPLRAAFALAILLKVSRDLAIPFSPREVRRDILAIAERGPEAAVQALRRLDHERRMWRAMHPEDALPRGQAPMPRHRGPEPTLENAEERAEAALDAAGARLLAVRRLGQNQLEVRYRFMDERFVTICDAITLGVYDSGVCLGHGDERGDRLLTLESLPAVIREAIDTGVLVITRRFA